MTYRRTVAISSVCVHDIAVVARYRGVSNSYPAQCKVHNCTATATVVARGLDSIERPTGQYELCPPHAEQVAERERSKSRKTVR